MSEETSEGVSTQACIVRALKEVTNPNPAPRPTPAQVFAELQKKLDDEALKEHYIQLEQRLQTERAQADQVFARLKDEAEKERKRANKAERKLRALGVANYIACPVLFALLAFGIASRWF